MPQYIDKDKLLLELTRRLESYKEEISKFTSKYLIADIIAKEEECKELISFLDTLEVKEVDLENSMVCKIDWYDGFLLDYTQEQQDTLLEKIGANVGDKIRVILIKE